MQFWGDCVLSACYIINRLPTPLLQNKTLFEVLFGVPPSYDHIKEFGCLAFAYTHRSTDKLNPRGLPCVFLGYPAKQKGYKLLDITTKHVFVSRDVKFHEKIFPYLQNIPNLVHPIPNGIHLLSSSTSWTQDDFDFASSETFPASPSPHLSSPISPIPSSSPPVSFVPQRTPITPLPLRQSTRQIKPPQWHNDYYL